MNLPKIDYIALTAFFGIEDVPTRRVRKLIEKRQGMKESREGAKNFQKPAGGGGV